MLKGEGDIRVCGYCAFGSCFNCKPTLTYYDKTYTCHCDHDLPSEGEVNA
jgi:hypothetical protein